MTKVAFIGLGRMGHGMAGRYLDAGFTVAVWNRSKAKAEDLIARGARWAASPADAADRCRRGRDHGRRRRSVARGVARQGRCRRDDESRAALAIECSTVSYQHALDMARELRGRGLVYIDSPVTGLPDAAAAGKLTLLVGAEPPISNAPGHISRRSATTIRHFGAVGTGTVYKLINNLMGAVQIASLAEGIAIAEQAGLDMNLVPEAMATGVVASPQVIRHSRRMVARDFSGATFTAALRHKDAAYAVALAESLLADAPLVGRAAVEAYASCEGSHARRRRRQDDRDRLAAEIASRELSGNRVGKPGAAE